MKYGLDITYEKGSYIVKNQKQEKCIIGNGKISKTKGLNSIPGDDKIAYIDC